MALEPQNVPVKMTSGIDTKSDPKSLETKLTVLQNASFQSPGQIQKRDGFMPTIPGLSNGIAIAAYKNEILAADGQSLWSYSPDTGAMVNKGFFQPVQLQSAQSVVSTIQSQSQPDSAIDSATGLKCFAYFDSGNGGVSVTVADTNTGTNLLYNALVDATSTVVKVALNGTNFVIIYWKTGGLYYKTISTAAPTVLTSAIQIDSTAVAKIDCTVANGNVNISYFDGSNAAKIVALSSGLSLGSILTIATYGFAANYISSCSDGSGNIWVIYGLANNRNYYAVVNPAVTSLVLSATQFSTENAGNGTVTVSGSVGTFFTELLNNFIADGHVIQSTQYNISGSFVSGGQMLLNCGIASKAFIYSGNIYCLFVYAGTNTAIPNITIPTGIMTAEPTYFLIRCVPSDDSTTFSGSAVVMKIAPSLAGGYYTTGLLPDVINLGGGNYSFPYLVETQANAVNGVVGYQTSLYSANFTFNITAAIQKINIASNMHFASGILWMYDGQNIVEHGFNIYPENIWVDPNQGTGGGWGFGSSNDTTGLLQWCCVWEWTDAQGNLHKSAPSVPFGLTVYPFTQAMTFSGDIQVLSPQVVGITSGATIFVGQVIVNTYFPTGTFVKKIIYSPGTTTIVELIMSNNSTVTSAPVTGSAFTTGDRISFSIRLPILSLTQKQNVSIVVYRTTLNGSVFYRCSSPSNQTAALNSLVINSRSGTPSGAHAYLSFIDGMNDNELIGNDELYTTGDVVENIEAPACSALATYKNRLLYFPIEDEFQWGYSQQVVDGSPVEFNSLTFIENVDQRVKHLTAGYQLDDKLILFGPTSKWYVVGTGPTPSGSQNDFSDATKIAGVSGCSNPNTIVEIPDGLMYQDIEKGIWLLTRGFNEQYIGADVEEFNGQTITSAQLFESQNKVMFTLASGTNLTYDYYIKQWSTDIFPASAFDATVFDNNLTYIQPDGLILQQTPGTYSDNGSVIPIQLETGWVSFTGLEGIGRVWEMQIMGTYFSPHTLTVNIYANFNSTTPAQVVTIPVLSPPNPYQFRIKLLPQKVESLMIQIVESQSGTPGQGFSLSSIAFRIGAKKGLWKLPAGASY